MSRVLFYCQNLLGVGHLTRSLALSRALVEQFDLVFAQGGPDIGKTLVHPRFERRLLPPLLMRESDSSLYDPTGSRDVERVFLDRARRLAAITKEGKFDHCLIELFPFGRRKFRREVLGLIEAVRAANPRARVHCSLRDIIVGRESPSARSEEAVQTALDRFDTVLVHSDPRFFRLEDSLAGADRLHSRAVYTGFVAEPGRGTTTPRRADSREKRILVSVGGGAVGRELLEATLAIAPRFPDFSFALVPGPFSPPELVSRLAHAAGGRIEISPFSNDFERELTRSALSISLGGYNTVMNVLRTGSKALVYPYLANREQEARARRFETAGLLRVITPALLAPDPLEAAIRAAIASPPPAADVDLGGAQATVELLRDGA